MFNGLGTESTSYSDFVLQYFVDQDLQQNLTCSNSLMTLFILMIVFFFQQLRYVTEAFSAVYFRFSFAQ